MTRIPQGEFISHESLIVLRAHFSVSRRVPARLHDSVATYQGQLLSPNPAVATSFWVPSNLAVENTCSNAAASQPPSDSLLLTPLHHANPPAPVDLWLGPPPGIHVRQERVRQLPQDAVASSSCVRINRVAVPEMPSDPYSLVGSHPLASHLPTPNFLLEFGVRKPTSWPASQVAEGLIVTEDLALEIFWVSSQLKCWATTFMLLQNVGFFASLEQLDDRRIYTAEELAYPLEPIEQGTILSKEAVRLLHGGAYRFGLWQSFFHHIRQTGHYRDFSHGGDKDVEETGQGRDELGFAPRPMTTLGYMSMVYGTDSAWYARLDTRSK